MSCDFFFTVVVHWCYCFQMRAGKEQTQTQQWQIKTNLLISASDTGEIHTITHTLTHTLTHTHTQSNFYGSLA